jgi:hypothetical protein
MAAKIIAFLITFITNIAAGVLIFFFMLIVMNGFRESDATWGLGIFIILAILIAILMSLGAVFVIRLLVKKQFSGAVSALIATPGFLILGIVLEIVAGLIGIGVAEFVRVNF